MTRDHDIKRAIRARMKVTGKPYTVARAALVAPSVPPAPGSETSESQGGTMASVHTELRDDLDERGFAVIRTFATPEQVARLTAAVDEVIAATVAEKQEEADQQLAAGERGINVWYPGEEGTIFKVVTDQPDVAWVLNDRRLLDIVDSIKGPGSTLRKIGALAWLPGFGHQGLHQDYDGVDEALGSWDRLVFVVMLSPHHADTGTIRALPGSHRTPPQFADYLGSAMPAHDDEVRIDGEPGDVLVSSGHLWKSGTFNSGREPVKSLLVAGHEDVGWGR